MRIREVLTITARQIAPRERPQALRAARGSARDLMEALQGLGMGGWEFLPRLQPIQAPWVYDLIQGLDQVDVIVCRNADLLGGVLARWRGSPPGP